MSILYIRDKDGKFVPIPAIQGANGKSAYESAKDGGYTGTEDEFNALLNGLTGFENAEHYVNFDNPHKVTAEQIGSLKMYSGFASVNADLGKKFKSDTPIGDIIKTLPDNTGLVADIVPSETQLYPSQYGTLTIYKIREQRVTITFREWNTYRLWLGNYTFEDGFKGFKCMVVNGEDDYITFEKDNANYKGGIGFGEGPSVALQLSIGEEGATEAPEEYTHRMELKSDGIEFLKKNTDGFADRYKIFGEHNKPSGEYDGTGESIEIDIDCWGSAVLIYGAGDQAGIVTPTGTFHGNGRDLGFTLDCTFQNGKLTLPGTVLNKEGHKYTWQVL